MCVVGWCHVAGHSYFIELCMIDATIIPEPVDGIFRVFRIGNDGNNDAWL